MACMFDKDALLLARRQHGWTIHDVAKKAGVSWHTAHRAEKNGRCNPDSLQKIAKALQVDVQELLQLDSAGAQLTPEERHIVELYRRVPTNRRCVVEPFLAALQLRPDEEE